MTLEWWHIAVFCVFIIACVIWNYIAGMRRGMQLTFDILLAAGLIKIEQLDANIIMQELKKNAKSDD